MRPLVLCLLGLCGQACSVGLLIERETEWDVILKYEIRVHFHRTGRYAETRPGVPCVRPELSDRIMNP